MPMTPRGILILAISRPLGRTAESVIDQFEKTVRPMHLEFVEPSKRHAELVVPEGGYNRVAVEMVVRRLRALLPSPEGHPSSDLRLPL